MGEEGEAKDRLPENVTAHQPLLDIIDCVRNRTGIHSIFMAISDVNARRVRMHSCRCSSFGGTQRQRYPDAVCGPHQACIRSLIRFGRFLRPPLQAIQRGDLPGVYGPSKEYAYHPSADIGPPDPERLVAVPADRQPSSPEDHVQTFVELGMLARGVVGFWSQSGFSNLARWMSGVPTEDGFAVVQKDGHGECWSYRDFDGPSNV